MSCSTLAPTGLVYVCTIQVLLSSRHVSIAPPTPFPRTVQVLFPSRSAGIAPPPPIFVGGPGYDWDCVLSLHVAGHPGESITLLRLMVVASSRLLLVPVGVGLMPVLIDAEPPFHVTPTIGWHLVS